MLTQVDDVLSEINIRKQLNERVLVTTLTKRMAEDPNFISERVWHQGGLPAFRY